MSKPPFRQVLASTAGNRSLVRRAIFSALIAATTLGATVLADTGEAKAWGCYWDYAWFGGFPLCQRACDTLMGVV